MTATRKPARKPARLLRIVSRPVDDLPAVVRLTVGRTSGTYAVYPVRGNGLPGRCMAFRKLDADDVYTVRVSESERICNCPGGTHHKHCKHADAAAVLLSRNLL